METKIKATISKKTLPFPFLISLGGTLAVGYYVILPFLEGEGFGILFVSAPLLIFLIRFFWFLFYQHFFVFFPSFSVSHESIIIYRLFRREEIKFSNIKTIELDQKAPYKGLVWSVEEKGICLSLKTGKKQYLLKHKTYKNFQEAIDFLTNIHPDLVYKEEPKSKYKILSRSKFEGHIPEIELPPDIREIGDSNK